MEFSVIGDRDPFLLVQLQAREAVFAESDAMVSMDGTLELCGEMRGGMLGALARKFVSNESLFTQRIEAARGAGQTLLAPALPGDIQILEVGPQSPYLLNDGAFLAAEDSVELSTVSQGLGKALLGGTGGFFIVKASGQGLLAVSGFGSIQELNIEPGQDVIIDNQHVVAWDARLDYKISVGALGKKSFLSRLVSSATSGEGIVTRFRGEGRVYISSRNIKQLAAELQARIMPPTE
jgi:uncharacterized protein (TIGR00266 family)